MKRTKTLRSLFFATAIALSFWCFSPVLPIDRLWTDFLLTCQRKAFPEDILLVSVTANDVVNHGSERLSRKYLADTLSFLDRCQAKRILLDMNLGKVITPEEESALLESLRSLGRDRIAIPAEKNPLLQTKDSIRDLCQEMQTSLAPDIDGRMRAMTGFSPMHGTNPCVWLASGMRSFDVVPIDLRLDLHGIRKVRLEELHGGLIAPKEIENKLVIVSIDRQIARTSVTLPVHGFVDRGVVLAMGTASSLQKYSDVSSSGLWLSRILFFATFAFGFFIGLRSVNVHLAFVGIMGGMIVCLATCWVMTVIYGQPSKPATTLIATIAAMKVALAMRLRINELLSGLFSGVLSPEEVWLWRAYGDGNKPVVLFDAMGHIKKANESALRQLATFMNSDRKGIPSLARKVMAVLGERETTLQTETSLPQVWDIHWPSDHIPLAVFTDVSEQQRAVQSLEEKLYTDPLTDEGSRAGFEAVLGELTRNAEMPFALIYMDMNGFKAVNDCYGHATGDALLRISAQRFRSLLAPSDYLARLGGDEFAIVIRRAISEHDMLVLRDAIEASLQDPIHLEEGLIKVGVAVGYAMRQSESESADEVIKRADREMYQRKSWLRQGGSSQRLPAILVANPSVKVTTVHTTSTP
jgi:diguanylate cyclase (GGDEF)-like protein